MNTKIFLLALALTACIASVALADGYFYGHVTYYDCTCSTDDDVYIRLMSGGNEGLVDIACSRPPYYSTFPNTFPPGWYYISVVIHLGSDCDYTYVKTVEHGTSQQQVNLEVYGPDGGGSGPPGP